MQGSMMCLMTVTHCLLLFSHVQLCQTGRAEEYLLLSPQVSSWAMLGLGLQDVSEEQETHWFEGSIDICATHFRVI